MKYLITLLIVNCLVMSFSTQPSILFPSLQSFFDEAKNNFNQIPAERKKALSEMSDYI